MVLESDATMQRAPQDNQLMSKHRVLSFKPQLRLEWQGHDGQNEMEQPDQSASLGDSITASTRIRFSAQTGVNPGSARGAQHFDAASSTWQRFSGYAVAGAYTNRQREQKRERKREKREAADGSEAKEPGPAFMNGWPVREYMVSQRDSLQFINLRTLPCLTARERPARRDVGFVRDAICEVPHGETCCFRNLSSVSARCRHPPNILSRRKTAPGTSIASRHSVTESAMFLNGFERQTLERLIRAGLATTEREDLKAGSQYIGRIRITEAGRRALERQAG
jgi:hypothetical protein